MKQVATAAAMLLTLAMPTSACALPLLTGGNARYTLERRFEQNEERYGQETYALDNCYRVSSTHVNCYAEVHESANRCEVWLWRVWETRIPHRRRLFGMHTQGQFWEKCAEESA